MENRDLLYEIGFQVLIIGMHISPAYLFLFVLLFLALLLQACFFHLLLN